MSVETGRGESTSLRARVVEVGLRHALEQRRLVLLAAELDASQEWAIDGSPTCAHWIADAIDVEVCTAREWLRVGRALAELETVDRAFAEGRLSYSKVRVLTRVATAENQVELCALAETVPAGQLRCELAVWRARHETPEQTEARQQAARRLTSRLDVDGMVVGTYRLPPAEAAVVHAAIDARVRANRRDASADAWPSLAQQRADGLMALARSQSTVTTEVILHVRGDGCFLDDGTPVAETVVERIAPRAYLRALVHDAAGRPINTSARRRHPSLRQQRIVRERDRACVDCGATEFLQFDHVPSYEQTRRTVVDELQLRCWRCHQRRHRRELIGPEHAPD
jgi:hypothetical protein